MLPFAGGSRACGERRRNASTGVGSAVRAPFNIKLIQGVACPVRIRHLFRWSSRATLRAMPFWLLRYKFTCSQAECGYHNALDAMARADTPKTAASQVGKSQHLCGRCGRPLTDSSSLKMAVPVPISSVEKKHSVAESGKPPSQKSRLTLTGFRRQ